jgi:hypothetical protein
MNLQWVLSHGCGADVAKRPLDQNLTTSPFPVGSPAGCGNQKPVFAGLLDMELAGLEPATSWVRSRFGRARPFHCSSSHLTNHRVSRDFQPFMPSRLHSASRPVALHLCQKRVTSGCLTCQRVCFSSEREAIVNACHAEVVGPTPGLEPGIPSLRGKSQPRTGVTKRSHK